MELKKQRDGDQGAIEVKVAGIHRAGPLARVELRKQIPSDPEIRNWLAFLGH
jgi:hypothetical protein